jgi:parvulin-like peptidyl-prolyl isomerase
VLATFEGGVVRQSDLRREERYLDRSEIRFRKESGHTEERNREDWTRRIALRAIAATVAAAEGLDQDPVVRELARSAQRDWLLSVRDAECHGLPMAVPSDEELRAELQGKEIKLPHRLRLSHIFLRATTDAERAAARERLEELRKGIRTLEQFREAARSHSQSESRALGGAIGWVRPGWIPREAEEALRKLPDGSISPPLLVRGGYHLFFVERNDPPHVLPLDRKLQVARSSRQAAARRRCREDLLATIRKDVGAVRASPDGTVAVGDWTVDLSVLAAVHGDGEEIAEEALGEVVDAELLFQRARATRELSDEESRRLKDVGENAVLLELVRRRAEARAAPPAEAELEAAFAARGEREYRTQRQMGLRVLSCRMPSGGKALAWWDRAVRVASDLGAGKRTWDAAARELQGTVEEHPVASVLAIVDLLGPPSFEAVKGLTTGGVSAPVRDGLDVKIIGVTEDRPMRPMTFAEARPHLERKLRREQAERLSEQVTRELLESHGFRMVPEGSH